MTPPGEHPVRLVPDRPFPRYSFVPGKSPHPTSDPAGHSYGVTAAPPPPVDPDRWAGSTSYLFGIDLFNGQFYWESHVEWESLWLAAGRKGAVADFLKGLIKLAAAGVKHLEGRPEGVKSHARRAAEVWKGVARSAGAGHYMGFSLKGLIDLAEAMARQGWPEAPPLLRPAAGEGQH
jgi:uncharacterized protein